MPKDPKYVEDQKAAGGNARTVSTTKVSTVTKRSTKTGCCFDLREKRKSDDRSKLQSLIVKVSINLTFDFGPGEQSPVDSVLQVNGGVRMASKISHSNHLGSWYSIIARDCARRAQSNPDNSVWSAEYWRGIKENERCVGLDKGHNINF
jgi:hypothetical protein